MAKTKDVANYLILLRNVDEKNGQYFSLSNLKLQKLLYYCQGGHYKWDNACLMTDAIFEAWRYGPVIEKLYRQLNKYGQADLPSSLGNDNMLTTNEKETIESVWNQLKRFHVFTLVEKTFLESPWKESYHKDKYMMITNEAIRLHFREEEMKIIDKV